MQTPPHSFDDAARGSTTSPEADFAEAERLRKQRELKRKSRERKKVRTSRVIPSGQSRAAR